MADRHPSVIKRHKQSEARRDRNRSMRSRLRHAIRSLRETIAAADSDKARTELLMVTRELDKAATKGLIHKNNASRHISRLASQVAALQ